MIATYDPNCVKCRYSRPGTPGDHHDHIAPVLTICPECNYPHEGVACPNPA